ISDAPDTVSAARFTRSGVLAAPVLLTQERCKLDGIRAVVANAGNANASTGVIGVPLDTDKIIRGISDARRELAGDGDTAFTQAISTTDRFEKRATLDVELPSGVV